MRGGIEEDKQDSRGISEGLHPSLRIAMRAPRGRAADGAHDGVHGRVREGREGLVLAVLDVLADGGARRPSGVQKILTLKPRDSSAALARAVGSGKASSSRAEGGEEGDCAAWAEGLG